MTDRAAAPSSGSERLVTGRSGRLFLTVSLGTFTIFAGRLVLSPLLPRIMAELSISRATAGIALSVMTALVALAQYPGGRLADALSRRTVLAASLLCLLGGAVALLGATTYAVFVVAVALTGVGRGLYAPAAASLISELFVEKRGRAFGIHEVFVNGGGLAAAGLAVLVPATATWRVAFLPVLAVFGVVLVLVHRLAEEPYAIERVGLDLRGTVRRVLAVPRVRRILLVFALSAFTVEGVLAFLPAFLQDAGFGPGFASNAFGAFFVVGILVNPVAGRLGDRIDNATVATAGALVAVVGLAAVTVADTPAIAAAGTVAFAVGQTSVWPVMLSELMSALPEGSAGSGYGAGSAMFTAVGSLGPAYVGVVADLAAYATAFAGLVGCLLAVAVLAATVRGR